MSWPGASSSLIAYSPSNWYWLRLLAPATMPHVVSAPFSRPRERWSSSALISPPHRRAQRIDLARARGEHAAPHGGERLKLVAHGAAQGPPRPVRVIRGARQRVARVQQRLLGVGVRRVGGVQRAVPVAVEQQRAVPVRRYIGDPGGAVAQRARGVRGGGGRAGAHERAGDGQGEREPPHARV